MRVKLFCPGMKFSEAAALSSSSMQNMANLVSIWLKLCKTNSGKESEPGKTRDPKYNHLY